MTTRAFIYDPEGRDISDEIELKNGKSNPFGWSQHEIWITKNVNGALLPERIGWVESGAFDLKPGYTYKTEELEKDADSDRR